MTAQAETVYRHFRADASHDISADVLVLSLDEVTWTSAATFIATGARPPECVAADEDEPPEDGLTGYWFRLLTGPTAALVLQRGMNTVFGKLTDTPEEPHFMWRVFVGRGE